MSERNDALIDIAKAVGFVLVVVVGGIFIAGVIDGYNEARDETEVAADENGHEAD